MYLYSLSAQLGHLPEWLEGTARWWLILGLLSAVTTRCSHVFVCARVGECVTQVAVSIGGSPSLFVCLLCHILAGDASLQRLCELGSVTSGERWWSLHMQTHPHTCTLAVVWLRSLLSEC